MSLVVNLYSGPGGGKSTTAALLFGALKQRNINVELVTEYVKSWAYEKRPIGAYDQFYFLGKQIRRESLLYGKVDVIITDSPVLMGSLYAYKYSPLSVAEGVRSAIMAFYRQSAADGHQHVHVMLNRSYPYQTSGRYESENEAKQIDQDIKSLLKQIKFPFIEHDRLVDDLDTLIQNVMSETT